MKRVFLAGFLALNLSLASAATVHIDSMPISEVAKQVSTLSGVAIVVPSTIQNSMSLYSGTSLSSQQLLDLFLNSVVSLGYSYRLEDGKLFLFETGTSNQSLMKVVTVPVRLDESLLNVLPNESRMFATDTMTVVYTMPSYFYLVRKLANEKTGIKEALTTKVYKSLSARPSQYLSLAGNDLTLKAFDDIGRLVAQGSPDKIKELDSVISALEGSISIYKVDLLIVSAAEDFNKTYNLNLSAPLGNVYSTLSGGISSARKQEGDGLQSLLTWIDQHSQLSILQKPHISLLDGKKARLLVGQEVPFETTRFDPSTSTGLITNTQRKDVGLALDISVNSLSSGMVRVQLHQELSSISQQQLEKSTDLITDKQTVQTVLDVQPERFYLIGGLSYEDKQKTVSGSPAFHQIEFLDDIFTDENENSSKRDLLIFIQLTDVSAQVTQLPSGANASAAVRSELVTRINKTN